MQLRKIKVYGSLRRFLGQSDFEAAVNSPQQAFNFLKANFEGIEKHMNKQLYRVKMGGRVITQDFISSSGQGEIQIVPIATGSGLFDFLEDVVNFFVDNAIPFVTAFFTGGVSLLAQVAAISLATDLLTPSNPVQARTAVGDTDPNIRGSYAFNGIQNVSTSGVPIPIIYGYVYSGSILISSGVDNAKVYGSVNNEGRYKQLHGMLTIEIANHPYFIGEYLGLDFLSGIYKDDGTLDTSSRAFSFKISKTNFSTNSFSIFLGERPTGWGNGLDFDYVLSSGVVNRVKVVLRNRPKPF